MAVNENIMVRLTANISDYSAKMQTAAAQTDKLATTIVKPTNRARQFRDRGHQGRHGRRRHEPRIRCGRGEDVRGFRRGDERGQSQHRRHRRRTRIIEERRIGRGQKHRVQRDRIRERDQRTRQGRHEHRRRALRRPVRRIEPRRLRWHAGRRRRRTRRLRTRPVQTRRQRRRSRRRRARRRRGGSAGGPPPTSATRSHRPVWSPTRSASACRRPSAPSHCSRTRA